jgi:hypothetical protein
MQWKAPQTDRCRGTKLSLLPLVSTILDELALVLETSAFSLEDSRSDPHYFGGKPVSPRHCGFEPVGMGRSLLLSFLRRCHFPFHSPKRCVPPEGESAMLRTHQQHERLEFALSDQRMEHTAHDIHLLAAATEHCGGADLVAAHISLTVARTVTLLADWPDLSAGVPN